MNLVKYSGFHGEDTRAIPIKFLKYASTYFRNLPDDVLKYIYIVLLGYNYRNGYFINKLTVPTFKIRRVVNEYVLLNIPLEYKKPRRFESFLDKNILIKNTNLRNILHHYFQCGYTVLPEKKSRFILIESIDSNGGECHALEVYNFRFTDEGLPVVIECKDFYEFAWQIRSKYNYKRPNEFVQITTENNSFKIVDRSDLSYSNNT